MRDIFFRLLVAAALTLAAFVLSSSAHGQQADEDASPTTSTPQEKAQKPPESETQSKSVRVPSSDQTQDELAFTGRVEQEKGTLVLKDPVTKLTYQLSDQAAAKKFIGKQVKVTGKLEMRSNTIEVDRIELLP